MMNGTLWNVFKEMNGSGIREKQLSPKMLLAFTDSAIVVSNRVIISVCFVGIVFNIINIVVMTRKRMASSTAMLLTGLAVSDMTALLLELSYNMDDYLYLDQPQHFETLGSVVLSAVYFWTFRIANATSNWMTVVIGTWRYIAVTWPLRAKDWCSKERTRKAIIFTFFLSAVLCMPDFIFFSIDAKENEGVNSWKLTPTDFAVRNKVLIICSLILFTRLVPCLILTVITVFLIRNLYQAAHIRRSLRNVQRDDHASMSERTTSLLLVVLGLFLISNMPYAAVCLLYLNLGKRYLNKEMIFFNILQMCVLVNHSINFVVYCFLSQNFRTTLQQIAADVRKFSVTSSFKLASSSTTNNV